MTFAYTGILYGNNIRAVLDNERSINLGSVCENAVASELIAHGHKLFYYDNRDKGEVDYMIDGYDRLSAVPIGVKSGKDYTVHIDTAILFVSDNFVQAVLAERLTEPCAETSCVQLVDDFAATYAVFNAVEDIPNGRRFIFADDIPSQ